MYNKTMKFEWDDDKSKTNKEKHGIDFEMAKGIWLDENRIEIQAPYPLESRWVIIGKLNNKVWTAIYTMRSGKIRIISVRHARKREVELYEEEKAC